MMIDKVVNREARRGLSWVRVGQILVVAALATFVLSRTSVTEIGSALAKSDARLALVAAALNVPVLILFGLRTHLALLRLGRRLPPRLLLPIAIVGNVAGSLTPAAAGESLRVALLRSHAGMTTDDGLALVLYERGISFGLMGLGTGVVIAYMIMPLWWAITITIVALPLFGLPVAVPWLLRLLPPPPPRETQDAFRRGLRHLRATVEQLRWLLEDRQLYQCWLLTTGAIFALETLQIWLLATGIGNALDFRQAWVAFGTAQFAAIVSLLPLGLGIADGSLAGLLSRMAMPLERGIVIAILVRAAVTLPLLAAALASYVYLLRRSPLTPTRIPAHAD